MELYTATGLCVLFAFSCMECTKKREGKNVWPKHFIVPQYSRRDLAKQVPQSKKDSRAVDDFSMHANRIFYCEIWPSYKTARHTVAIPSAGKTA